MLGLIEPEPVRDIFCSGIGAIEDIGNGCFRVLIYVAEQGEKIVVAKLVSSNEQMPAAMRLLLRAMGVPFLAAEVDDVALN